jgi:xanthine/uracil permease
MVAIGVIVLWLSMIGPRSLWGLAGSIPLMIGLVGGRPLFRIFGLTPQPARSPSRMPSRRK